MTPQIAIPLQQDKIRLMDKTGSIDSLFHRAKAIKEWKSRTKTKRSVDKNKNSENLVFLLRVFLPVNKSIFQCHSNSY